MADLRKGRARKSLAVGRIWLTRNDLNGDATISLSDNETEAYFTLILNADEAEEISQFISRQTEGK